MVLYLLNLAGWIGFSILLQYEDMTWMYIATGFFGSDIYSQFYFLSFCILVQSFPTHEKK